MTVTALILYKIDFKGKNDQKQRRALPNNKGLELHEDIS